MENRIRGELYIGSKNYGMGPTSRAPSRKLPMYNPQCIPQIENMISWPTGSVLAFDGHQDALHLTPWATLKNLALGNAMGNISAHTMAEGPMLISFIFQTTI